MKALLENNRILLTFSYNPLIIMAIKQKIMGYQWHPERKLWSIPYSDSNIEKIRDWGFDISHLEMLKQEKKLETSSFITDIKTKYPHLYNFQVEGVAKAVSNRRLLILDETGTGKSMEALSISDYLHSTNKVNRTLYIVKKSNVKQWQREATRFYDFRLFFLKNMNDLAFKGEKHIVMTYDRFKIDYSDDITKPKILNTIVDKDTCLILDEAACIKNVNTIRYKKIAHALDVVSYAYGLTGSSMSTHLIKFWVVGNTFCHNWMSKREFYKFCVYDQYSEYPLLLGYKNLDTFKDRLLQIAIRRTKKEVRADMPDKLYEERFIDLDINQMKQIKGITKDLKVHKGSIVDFELITKVHMIEQGQSKINDLISLIEDELSDEKIVIFSHYLKTSEDITKQLNDKDIKTMYPLGDITDAVECFRTNDSRIMVLTDRASEGTDIPFATCLINFDVRWNTDDMLQREDRIYRINSKSNVLIITMVSNGIELYMFRYMMEARERGKEIDIAGMKEQMNTYLYNLR